MSVAAKASFWFFVCNVLQKTIVLLTVPIITRMLTTAEYGMYSIFVSWGNIFIIIATLNLNGGGYYVGMNKFEDQDKYTSAVAGLICTCTTLLFLIFIVFSHVVTATTGLTMFMIVLTFFWIYGQGGINLWFVKNRYEYKYRPIVVATIFTAVTTPILKILLIKFAENAGIDKSYGAIIGYIIPVILVGFIAWYLIFYKGKKYCVKEYWKFAIIFNIPLIPYYLSQQILNQADRVMIQILDSDASAGIYSVAYQMASAVAIVNSAINSTFVPWQFQTMKKGENKKVSSIFNIILAGITIIHLFVIAVAPEIMKFFAASSYFSAIYVIPPVTIGVLFSSYTLIFINTELFYEKNQMTSISSIIAAILNVILNWIAIPRYGYIAAGYTTLICYFINMIFHGFVAVELVRKHGDDRAFDIKAICGFSVVSITLMFVFLFLYPYALIRYGIIITCIVVALIFRNRLINLATVIVTTVKKKGR